jgi:prenyltransferase beta subunit
MTIRLSTIQAASNAIQTLGESSQLVAEFVRSRFNNDGGFNGRSDKSDLYYTVFGIETLLALDQQLHHDLIKHYLSKFKLSDLDLVHLGCMGRCLAGLGGQVDNKDQIIAELNQYRSADGGFNNIKNSQRGTMYGAFVATALYQDMSVDIVDTDGLLSSIESLKMSDASFGNDKDMIAGAVPSTAAAVTLNHFLKGNIQQQTLDWLLSQIHPKGGFTVIEGLPFADLLSTATVLHALALAGVKLDGDAKEDCLDFIDSLWSGTGGFCGSYADQAVDCEYTFYGLMAIGHLSE